MNRTSVRLLVLALLFAASGATATQAAGMPVAAKLPDGRALSFQCEGHGAPTVVLESGWAADSAAWRKVVPLLSGEMRVCAYDRPGSGRSDAGPLPRDGAAIARDLDDGLRAAGIGGPFLLVGHSAGGLYIRHFALRRPADVAGLVLVDSSIAHQQRRFEAVFGPGAGSLDGLIARSRGCLEALSAARDPGFSADVASSSGFGADPVPARCRVVPPDAAIGRWSARLSELETLGSTTSTALDGGEPHLAHVPIIVLTAGKSRPPPVLDIWAGFHREIAAASACGTARVIDDSGHMMIFDRPDAIADAVREVSALHLAALRSGKPCTRGPP